MKNLIILALVFTSTSVLGQALSLPANSMQFREFAQNAEPIAHARVERSLDKQSAESSTLKTNSQNVEVSAKQAEQTESQLSINDIVTILNERMMITENEVQTRQFNDETANPLTEYKEKVELKLDFTIYPNPTNDSFVIRSQFEKPLYVNLYLYDSSGQLVMDILTEVELENQFTKIVDISKFSTGNYVVTMEAGSYMVSKSLVITK